MQPAEAEEKNEEWKDRLPWSRCPRIVYWLELHQWDEHPSLIALLERKASKYGGVMSAALYSLTLWEIQQELVMTDIEKVSLIGLIWDFFILGEEPTYGTGERWNDKVFQPTIIALLEQEGDTSFDTASTEPVDDTEGNAPRGPPPSPTAPALVEVRTSSSSSEYEV